MFKWCSAAEAYELLLLKQKVSACVMHSHLSGCRIPTSFKVQGDNRQSLQAKHLLGGFCSQLIPDEPLVEFIAAASIFTP